MSAQLTPRRAAILRRLVDKGLDSGGKLARLLPLPAPPPPPETPPSPPPPAKVSPPPASKSSRRSLPCLHEGLPAPRTAEMGNRDYYHCEAGLGIVCRCRCKPGKCDLYTADVEDGDTRRGPIPN